MKDTAYSWDSKGFYNGMVKCQPCQRELGVFFLPARATWIAPPPSVSDKNIKWLGDKWGYVEIERRSVELVRESGVIALPVRENVDLLSGMIANLKVELMKEINSGMGKVRGSVASVFDRQVERLETIDKGFQAFSYEIRGMSDRISSLEQELSISRFQIEEAKKLISSLQSQISETKNEVFERDRRLNEETLKELPPSKPLAVAALDKKWYKPWA